MCVPVEKVLMFKLLLVCWDKPAGSVLKKNNEDAFTTVCFVFRLEGMHVASVVVFPVWPSSK